MSAFASITGPIVPSFQGMTGTEMALTGLVVITVLFLIGSRFIDSPSIRSVLGSNADRPADEQMSTAGRHNLVPGDRTVQGSPQPNVGGLDSGGHNSLVQGTSTDGAASRTDSGGLGPNGHNNLVQGSNADRVSPPDDSNEFLTDEARVIGMLEANGGQLKQSIIVDETEWSKSKVSRLLSNMEANNQIEKISEGRENLITLPGAHGRMSG